MAWDSNNGETPFINPVTSHRVSVGAYMLLRNIALSSTPGGLDVIRKEAWTFYRTISGVRLCWELEEPKGPTGVPHLQEEAPP